MMRYIEVELIEEDEEEGARRRSFCVVLFLFFESQEKPYYQEGLVSRNWSHEEKAQFETKPSEKPKWGNLICTELSFDDKGFVLSAFKTELSLWISFTCSASKVATRWQIWPLWTRVELSLRVKPVISHLGIANYKYAAPAVICGCWLVRGIDLIGWELPKKDTETKQKSLPLKLKSHWTELIQNDLGGNLLAFLSWRTAILLDG